MSDDRGPVIALNLRNVEGAKEGMQLQIKIATILGKRLQRSESAARSLIQSGKVPSLANAKIDGKGGATCILATKEYDILIGAGQQPAKPSSASGALSEQLSVKRFDAPNADPKSEEYVGFGVVQPFAGAVIFDKPDSVKGTGKRYKRNTRVFVCREIPGNWYQVRLENDDLGYVDKDLVWINPPDPDAILYKIEKDETALEIATRAFRERAEKFNERVEDGEKVDINEWGADLRHYARVLVSANVGPQNGVGRRGISYEDGAEEDWEKIKAIAGVEIWIPSIEFAQSLKGKIPTDSITYSIYAAVRQSLGLAGDFFLGNIAFRAGILHGALESIWDLVVGIVDLVVGIVDLLEMVWDLVKSLFTGKLFSFLKEVWDWVVMLSSQTNKELMAFLEEAFNAFLEMIKKVIKGGIEAFRKNWYHDNFLRRWHFRGWVIGYAVAEVLLELFSGGGAAVAKWGTRFGKFIARLVKEVSKIKDFWKRAKQLKIPGPNPESKQKQLKELIDQAAGKRAGSSKGGQKAGSGPEASSRTDKGGQAKPSAPEKRSNGSSKAPGGENSSNKAENRSSDRSRNAPEGENTRAGAQNRSSNGSSRPRPKADVKHGDANPRNNNSTGNKKKPQASVVDDVNAWPPTNPKLKGPKPDFGEPNAAEWRYNRYRYEQYTKYKKKQEDLPSFEEYKRRNYAPAAKGGRAGRRGGPDQVKTRKMLEAQEGFTDMEKKLGDNYVDLFKPNNGLGGADYVEVDDIIKKGIPKKRLRRRLKAELTHLKEGDRLIYVDKVDPSKRIIYKYGDDPSIVDTRTWKD